MCVSVLDTKAELSLTSTILVRCHHSNSLLRDIDIAIFGAILKKKLEEVNKSHSNETYFIFEDDLHTCDTPKGFL